MFFLISILIALSLCSCASVPEGTPRTVGAEVGAETLSPGGDDDCFAYEDPARGAGDLPELSFNELWCYLTEGREQSLDTGYPITDLVCFGAEIDSYGKLTNVPYYTKLSRFPGRLHLALACNSRGLTHFVLESGSAARRQLVADLLEASGNFDGLQIDFELIPARDRANFISFLAELRKGLGNKLFTVALPARHKALENDVFDYETIAPLVDRVFVMAYDEHWSASEPGPIASLDWCRSVAEYALKTIGPDKLIMGMPFYGRSWGSFNPSRAFFHSGIERIRAENSVDAVERKNGVPTFSYETAITVTVYYEDIYSLALKGHMYRDIGVAAVGFWSLGQEDTRVWNCFTSPRGKSAYFLNER
jgi:spore germination protein YaaH